MSVLELFSLNQEVTKLQPSEVTLEKNLQKLIEDNMEKFFNVRFLKSEYKITEGRMDSIGIDENNCPVIFEYKRSINENVINQGLFYLDWLMDHQGDFKNLVLEKFKEIFKDNCESEEKANNMAYDIANKIDWSSPCVICVASDFTKYDLHAVNQIERNIKLVRYRKYGDDLILFEHLNTQTTKENSSAQNQISVKENVPATSNSSSKTFEEQLKDAPENLRAIYNEICAYIESLGDDIEFVKLKYWLAYKKTRNFTCIVVYNTQVTLYLKLDPESVELDNDFAENVKGKGHLGTGDLKLNLKNESDLIKAKPLIERAYNEI